MDITKIKAQFPILNRKINGKPLIYLDNASTTQKPKSVIEALKNFYENHNANTHRGIHTLSEESTELYEATRKHTATFLNAASEKEIVFTRNATESINLIAYTWGTSNIKRGDEILITAIEHHSNLVPWQQLAAKNGATLKQIPIKDDFTLDLKAYTALLSDKTKLVSITGMSNVLGTIPPVKEMIALAHQSGAVVCVDGAQSVAHQPTDVQDLDADFFVLSAHKMLGPTGVGVLYAKLSLLEKMPPFLYGGDMINEVSFEKTTFSEPPWKFEAGTQNIADVVAFKKALEFLDEIGMEKIKEHEQKLTAYTKKMLAKFEDITVFAPEKSGPVLSFSLKGVHPHDIATIFDAEGIAIRSGEHCAQPLMKHLKVPATARISLYLYNTTEEIDHVEQALKKVITTFK